MLHVSRFTLKGIALALIVMLTLPLATSSPRTTRVEPIALPAVDPLIVTATSPSPEASTVEP